jgi:hypothetical protein
MPDPKGRVVIEAHALRRAASLAALLHGSRRGPRELKRLYGPLIASVILGAVLLLGVWAAYRIGGLLHHR